MKASVRLLSIMVLVALCAAGVVTPAAAQGDDVYCNGLSDADCQILLDSSAAMADVTAFSVPEWSVGFEMQAGEESVSLAARGALRMALPEDAMALFGSMPTDMATDFTPFLSVLEAIDADWVEQFLNDVLMNWSLDEMVLESPDEDMALSDMALALKDGTVYVYLTAPNGAGSWFGEPIELTARDREELDDALAEMRTMFAADLDSPELAEATAMMEQMAQASEAMNAVVSQYVTTTRLADETVNGQAVAVFETTFDMPGLLSDPALPAIYIDLLNDPAFAAMMEEDEAFESEQITEAQLQLVMTMVGLMLDDTSYTTQTWVGLEDGYQYHTEADMSLAIDTSLFGEEAAAETVAMHVSFSIDMADLNAVAPDQIEAPADYEPLRRIDDFLPGDPSLITAELIAGVPVNGAFDEMGGQAVYALVLEAGDAASVTLDSAAHPDVEVYGPDGFYVADLDAYFEDALDFTARDAGMYLVSVEGYSALSYALSVAVE